MPVDLQQKVLEKLLGEDLSTLWKTLLVDREFNYPGGQLRYAVGQPMGMLSSWAAMAITHHAIMNYCHKGFYGVIGDDMAIASKNGTEKYEEIGKHTLNSSHITISYAVFCLKKKKNTLRRDVNT